MTELAVPKLALVALVGASGSGKSTFAAKHFGRFEVLSSDFCRGLVADDENDQSATTDAFDVLGHIAGVRLRAGRLTVVDATNVQRSARKSLVDLARANDVLPVAIVLDVPVGVCLERNRSRADRDFADQVVRRQHDELRRSVRGLAKEGFRRVHVLRGVAEVEAATITREPLLNDKAHLTGPFDVIGDVHGCRSELETLLASLGYALRRDDRGRAVDAAHPDGRTVVFVGDLVDRGPDSPGVLRLAMGMVRAGHALAVPGNHEHKLVRALRGRDVRRSHGLAETLAQLAAEPPEFVAEVETFCHDLVSHLVLDGGALVVAHAGLKEAYHGRASGRVRSFALYGDTTGETDEYGLPVRYPWADEYRGRATVLYGHTPTPTAEWINNTMCLDTGCVFGGALTALRWPEREVVSTPAEAVWYEPARPLRPHVEERAPDDLNITDVLGRRGVETRHRGRITIREEHAAGAIEVMSRFALDPRWLLHLPPTMAPPATSKRDGLLEHPDEAFAEYRDAGVPVVVCQEKHMGSRAITLVCRSADVARRRFAMTDGMTGVIHTRTGRAFFPHAETETLLGRVRAAVDAAGLWDTLQTDWLLLDGEILPWSAKAGGLLRGQYASVGAAATAVLPVAVRALEAAAANGIDVGALLARTRARESNAAAFVDAYRRYVWPTDGVDGVRLAPFQVLATEGRTWHDHDHGWHLDIADALVAAAPAVVQPTRRLLVRLDDDASIAEGVRWWDELTTAGGEGMVVKPLANLLVVEPGARGAMPQPGTKVRGREYLRIVYGPDYTEPEHLTRLRERHLGHKRSLAIREYALGLESLDRAVAGEPLWRVHEAAFAVLALEAEPVDPRL